MIKTKPIDIILLRETFFLKGGVLHWKKCRIKKLVNQPITTKNERGYITVGYNGRRHYAHRLIWAYFHKKCPGALNIDHINGIKSDNRPENLRLVTNLENSRNLSISKTNTSGRVGVVWNKGVEKWQASIGLKGKLIYLGVFKRKDGAIAAREAAERKYSYHQNHGRVPETKEATA
jgi:hypothetical protein